MDRTELLALLHHAQEVGWTNPSVDLAALERRLTAAKDDSDKTLAADASSFATAFLATPVGQEAYKKLTVFDPAMALAKQTGRLGDPFPPPDAATAPYDPEIERLFAVVEGEEGDEGMKAAGDMAAKLPVWLRDGKWGVTETRRVIALMAKAKKPSPLMNVASVFLKALHDNWDEVIARKAWKLDETKLFLKAGLDPEQAGKGSGQFVEAIDLIGKLVAAPDVWSTEESTFLLGRMYLYEENHGTIYTGLRPYIEDELFSALVLGGHLTKPHIEELIRRGQFFLMVDSDGMVSALVKRGLLGKEEIDLLIRTKLERDNSWGGSEKVLVQSTCHDFIKLVPAFRKQGLWGPEETERLIRQFWKINTRSQTEGQQLFLSYVNDIWEAYRMGLLNNLNIDPDIFWFKALALDENNKGERYWFLSDIIPKATATMHSNAGSIGRISALVGGKWAGLMRARELGIPVSPGFVTPVFRRHASFILRELDSDLGWLEKETGKKFWNRPAPGDPSVVPQDDSSLDPLLVAVRSGAPMSFPGELATILNVGMNDEVAVILARKYGERFANEAYATFLRSFAVAVWEIPEEDFDPLFDAGNAVETVTRYKALIAERGHEISDDPLFQLQEAWIAVRKSWDRFEEEKGVRLLLDGYPWGQKKEDTPLHTAVVIQEVAFGNLDDQSGSGVALSRNPQNGDPNGSITFRRRSQGIDVVTPRPGLPPADPDMVSSVHGELVEPSNHEIETLREWLKILEKEYGTAVEIEFVVESGKLYLTQVRRLIAVPEVRYRINEDLARESVISEKKAARRRMQLPEVVTTIDVPPETQLVAKSSITNGIARTGFVAFSIEDAETIRLRGDTPIMIFDSYGRSQKQHDVRPGEGMIEVDRHLSSDAAHIFHRFTREGKAIHYLSDYRKAFEDTGPIDPTTGLAPQRYIGYRLGSHVFRSFDSITLLPDGRIFAGQFPVTQIPIAEAATRLASPPTNPAALIPSLRRVALEEIRIEGWRPAENEQFPPMAVRLATRDGQEQIIILEKRPRWEAKRILMWQRYPDPYFDTYLGFDDTDAVFLARSLDGEVLAYHVLITDYKPAPFYARRSHKIDHEKRGPDIKGLSLALRAYGLLGLKPRWESLGPDDPVVDGIDMDVLTTIRTSPIGGEHSPVPPPSIPHLWIVGSIPRKEADWILSRFAFTPLPYAERSERPPKRPGPSHHRPEGIPGARTWTDALAMRRGLASPVRLVSSATPMLHGAVTLVGQVSGEEGTVQSPAAKRKPPARKSAAPFPSPTFRSPTTNPAMRPFVFPIIR